MTTRTRPRTETRAVRLGAALLFAGFVVALCATTWAGFVVALAAECVGGALLFRAGIESGRWESS